MFMAASSSAGSRPRRMPSSPRYATGKSDSDSTNTSPSRP
jgi:hypothetical protein